MGDDWNSFIQSKRMQVLMNALVAVICGYYTVGAVFELVSPGDTGQMLIEQIGSTGYYALTVARMLVCAWVAVVSARAAARALTRDDK